MTIAITPILLLLTGILVHSIGRFFIEKSQLETDKQRYKSLSSALTFGEIIIPKDSWINSTGTVEYPFENFKDIRQGLYKARLSTPIEIANFPTAAFEVTYRGVLLELAQTYAYKLKAIEHTCKKGWLIDLRYPDEIDRNNFYQDQSGSWFTPSQWEIAQCFQTTGGISVIAINPKLGLYVIKPTDNK